MLQLRFSSELMHKALYESVVNRPRIDSNVLASSLLQPSIVNFQIDVCTNFIPTTNHLVDTSKRISVTNFGRKKQFFLSLEDGY